MSDSAKLSGVMLAPGGKLGGYTVIESITTEDVGTLYLARSEAGTNVFLRQVSSAVVADADRLERLETNLAKLEKVEHRNVAQVVGGGEEDEGFYYVLDALSTTSLSELMKNCRPLYERELVWLGRGLTAGMAALHGAELFHGGLTPTGVAMSHHGPIIVDLGWSSRIGRGKPPALEKAQAKDMKALRETLLFAITPQTGSAPALTDRVNKLLDGLEAGKAKAFEMADNWKAAADRLGLPDPMAPDTLKKLLERYENKSAPSSSSDELTPVKSADTIPSVPSPPTTKPKPPKPPTIAETPSTVSAAALSAVAYAKNMLADFPVDPSASQYDSVDSEPPAPKKPVVVEKKPNKKADKKPDKKKPDKKKPDKKTPAKKKTAKAKRPKPEAPKPVVPSKPHSQTGKAPKIGRFGCFELVREISTGRSSAIYLANKDGMDRSLAVKILLKDALDDQPRFMRAAETAESLQHTNITKVIDSGTQDGWVYVASTYAKGPTLKKVCREETEHRGQLPHIMFEVLKAVEHAHERGITHGNLKADNIVVTEKGQPRILEFGFGLPQGKGVPSIKDSPYFAPEVQAGASPDESSDIYSLGVILFEAATWGRLPGDISGGLSFLAGSPPAPSGLQRGVPWQIDAIVRKAMQPKRANRYAKVADMSDDLERCLLGAVRAPRPSAIGRFMLWSYKSPIAAVLTLIVIAAACVGLGMGTQRVLDAFEAQERLAGMSPGGSPDTPDVPPDTPPDVPPDVTPDFPPDTTPVVDTRELDELRAKNSALATERDQLEREAQEQRQERQNDKAAHERQTSESAARLVELADGLLDTNPGLAKRVYQQALEIAPLQSAEEGVANAEVKLSQPPVVPDKAEDPAAKDALAEGLQHLAAGRHEDARRSLRKALALGEVAATDPLTQAERGLFEKERGDDAAERREDDAEEADRLARQGDSYVTRGALDEAWDSYLAALAKAPDNAQAHRGLKSLAKLRGEATARPAKPASEQVEAKLTEAASALTSGRQAYKRGEQAQVIYSAYLFSLKALDSVLVLDPQNDRALRERITVAQELAAILRDNGNSEFADLILRINGLEDAPVKRVQLPEDPYLVIEEYDRVSIRRAFGGSVRFEPTDKAFSRLRKWIKGHGERYRIRIQVKSTIEKGFPPKILATGLWVVREDKVGKTKTPPTKLTFEGGPFRRLVVVDSRGGRVVRPFTRINTLDRGYVGKSAAVARQLILEAKGLAED